MPGIIHDCVATGSGMDGFHIEGDDVILSGCKAHDNARHGFYHKPGPSLSEQYLKFLSGCGFPEETDPELLLETLTKLHFTHDNTTQTNIVNDSGLSRQLIKLGLKLTEFTADLITIGNSPHVIPIINLLRKICTQ